VDCFQLPPDKNVLIKALLVDSLFYSSHYPREYISLKLPRFVK